MKLAGWIFAFSLCCGMCGHRSFAQSPTDDISLQQKKLDIELQRERLEIQGVRRELETLTGEVSRRWADEKEKIKEDRDRAWNELRDDRDRGLSALKDDRDKAWSLFTQYIWSLIGGGVFVASFIWGFLWWWSQNQKSAVDSKIAELDGKINQLPLLQDGASELIEELRRGWPTARSEIRELQDRLELEQLKSEIGLFFLRGGKDLFVATTTISDESRRREIIEREIEKVTMTMRLLSGELRYVHQAVNILSEGDIADEARKLLPRLRAIYRKINPELVSEIDRLIVTHGVAPASQ